MITICISVLIYDIVNRTRGVSSERSGSERDANKVELATAHRTKSRADVLLIKIPPAPPSRNGGHVLCRTFRFTLSCTRLTFFDNGYGVSSPCMKRNSFAMLYKIRACMEDWQNKSSLIECMKVWLLWESVLRKFPRYWKCFLRTDPVLLTLVDATRSRPIVMWTNERAFRNMWIDERVSGT